MTEDQDKGALTHKQDCDREHCDLDSESPLDAPCPAASAADDDDEWEYVYEDELEEGDEWEYLDKEEEDSNPLSYKKVQSATDDLNSVVREGAAAARELKEAYDDIKGALDIKNLFKF